MLQSDGDIIRGLGYVTIYSAYLEEQIDYLLEALGPIEPMTRSRQRLPTSKKIKEAKKCLSRLDSTELQSFPATLDACSRLFERRNELIHGRIYSGFGGLDRLRSGRASVPERPVTADELYDLANKIFEMRSHVLAPQISQIPRAIQAHVAGV